MVQFIHLKCQSSYSLLESTIKLDNLVEAASGFNMPAIAVCDSGNLFGALEFSLKAQAKGMQPIHGCTVNIKQPNGKSSELTLIAKDEAGYKNLLYLVSLYCTSSERQLELETIFEKRKGLIILSGYTKGAIGQLLLSEETTLAKAFAARMLDIFGENFYCEITRHELKEEKLIEDNYIRIASDLGIPLVATNKVVFLDKDSWDSHDTFLCISNSAHKDSLERPRASSHAYLKSEKSMVKLFEDLPSALKNSVAIAKRCSFMAHSSEPMMPVFLESGSEKELLIQLSKQGLSERLKTKFETENTNLEAQKSINDQYFSRLEYELNLLCKMEFAGYFLIVSDFVRWSLAQGIPVGPGRGSVVGSMVAWSLKITDLDPIGFGLLFERFLNPERVQMPDIDIDFCQERRGEVIQYVRSKYGAGKVAHIITFGSLQAKAAIKDVARALGLRFNIANIITNLIPFNAVSPVTLAQAIEQVPQLKSLFKGELIQSIQSEDYDDEEDLKDLIKRTLSTALALEGLPRHVSIHAAGVIISRDDLVEVLPLYKSAHDDTLLVQYPMKYAELAGLVKFDFLGLQTLTLIAHCCHVLAEKGIEIDFKHIPLNDSKTYQLLCSGYVKGVFQFESAGMRDNLQKFRPDKIDDLMALGSLYRPGPMDNIPTYIACKFGYREAQYLHPMLEPILKPTYGVIIYQEQVMEIARVLAGYSMAQADLLRRAMGKKVASEMQQQKEIFVDGAVGRGVKQGLAQEIFELVAKFAGYGFNKSHAAAYAVISYRTAYLKAHYPVEFFVAFLNLEFNDSNKINSLISESKELGIELIKPCINFSSAQFSSFEGKLCFGLGAIKNVSLGLAKEIVKIRESEGPFKSITDFLVRVGGKNLNKKVLEGLIQAGCFDSLHSNRAELFLNSERLSAHAARAGEDALSSQMLLIASQPILTALKTCKPWSKRESLYREFEATGVFLNGHPLDAFKNFFQERSIHTSASLKELPDGAHNIKLAGIIQKKDARSSARGIFALLVLSDHCGNFEAGVYNEQVLKEEGELLAVKSELVMDCEVAKSFGSIRIVITNVTPLEEYIRQFPYDLTVELEDDSSFKEFITCLSAQKRSTRGQLKVSLLIRVEGSLGAKVKLPCLFDVNLETIEHLSKFASSL